MPGHRIEKINQLIQQEVNNIILREIDLPEGALVTLTKVETSKDLHNCTLWISVIPGDKQSKTLNVLQKDKKQIRYLLANRVKFRIIPELKFKLDLTESNAAHIDHLIDKIHKES